MDLNQIISLLSTHSIIAIFKNVFKSSPEDIVLLLLETEGQRNIDAREAWTGCLLYTPGPGIAPRPGIVRVLTGDYAGRCPDSGLNLQPRYVPWQGIKPTTLQLGNNTPTNRATLAGAYSIVVRQLL